jgi:hypothetical protein
MEGIFMHRQTAFGAWIERVGVVWIYGKLHEMGQDHAVTIAAIYQWWRREHEPRMSKIRDLVAISGGSISVEDVLEHFHPANKEEAASAK